MFAKKGECNNGKITKSYEERMLEMEKKEQEALKKQNDMQHRRKNF